MRRAAVVLLALAAAAPAAEKTLQHDDGEMAGKRSTAGTGHVVAFERPRGKWWVKSVSVHGARYGGGYDPATTTFTVTVCDADLKPLGAATFPYDRFAYGRFAWTELGLDEPVEAPPEFKVVVEFFPTATQGVYVASAEALAGHSFHGVPGGEARPFDGAWMIRATLTNRKPKAVRKKKRAPPYLGDFEFLERTVRDRFPALKKKGVDWKAVCRERRPQFADCKDDREHVRNAARLLAVLDDMHTGVSDAHTPAFDGLHGGGAWIAAEGEKLLLRAWADGHPLADEVPRGSLLLAVGERTAAEAHAEVRRRLREWHGWSSPHFLDARLSFQFFAFDGARTLPARFRTPDGREVEVELRRDAPPVSRVAATMPAGVEPKGRAVGARLDGETGYLRILGGMDEETRAEFDRALDGLRGVRGIVLDGRGMGGGGDGPAWAMAGRFFARRTPQGSAPALEPTGEWQFEGPVVLLQDERMVSSAETFVWAMTETERALSVGRPTGGATIIPQVFEAPSGLFRFRLGVHDRKTPVRGVQPEGEGTPPDVFVAYDPERLAREEDPILATGRAALRLLLEGKGRDRVVSELK